MSVPGTLSVTETCRVTGISRATFYRKRHKLRTVRCPFTGRLRVYETELALLYALQPQGGANA